MDFILPLAIMSTAFLSLSRKVLKKYSASLIPSNYLSPNFDYLNDPIPPRLGIIGSFLSIFGNSIFGKFIGDIGIGVAGGTTVVSFNTSTRMVTLSANNAGTVTGNIIFGEEVSVNWTNIDIQRTIQVNQALAGLGQVPGTRLYLYGYTVSNAPPSTRVQGFTIGARQDGEGNAAVPDKLNVLLTANGATEATIHTAEIAPYGPSVSGLAAGVAGSPLQYDATLYDLDGDNVAESVGGWYLTVDSNNNDIYTTITTNTTLYQNANFTPTTFFKRIPDKRDLQDRTYRIRYVIDKDKTNPLPRDPISGYVMQPLNSDSTNYSLDKCYYIYDIEIVQEFERGVNDGIYYITFLCASISPSTLPSF